MAEVPQAHHISYDVEPHAVRVLGASYVAGEVVGLVELYFL